ncbi:hypothetical protein REH76_09750, partial [Photobacterium damselae]
FISTILVLSVCTILKIRLRIVTLLALVLSFISAASWLSQQSELSLDMLKMAVSYQMVAIYFCVYLIPIISIIAIKKLWTMVARK